MSHPFGFRYICLEASIHGVADSVIEAHSSAILFSRSTNSRTEKRTRKILIISARFIPHFQKPLRVHTAWGIAMEIRRVRLSLWPIRSRSRAACFSHLEGQDHVTMRHTSGNIEIKMFQICGCVILTNEANHHHKWGRKSEYIRL